MNPNNGSSLRCHCVPGCPLLQMWGCGRSSRGSGSCGGAGSAGSWLPGTGTTTAGLCVLQPEKELGRAAFTAWCHEAVVTPHSTEESRASLASAKATPPRLVPASVARMTCLPRDSPTGSTSDSLSAPAEKQLFQEDEVPWCGWDLVITLLRWKCDEAD